MRQRLNRIIALNIVFVFLLLLSGSTKDNLSDLLYLAAFLLPIAGGFLLLSGESRRTEETFPGNRLHLLPKGSEARKATAMLLPFAFPSLLLIFLLAFLTSLLLGAFGWNNPAVQYDSFPRALLLQAILPALLEEILFRYLPLRLLEGEDPKNAIFYSALFFALIHCNLFQMPYAFAAGLLFAWLDLRAGNLLPSLILHLFNNIFSLLQMQTDKSGWLSWIYPCALIFFSLISAIYVFSKKDRYLPFIFHQKGGKSKLFFSFEAILFAIIPLYIAVSVLLLS